MNTHLSALYKHEQSFTSVFNAHFSIEAVMEVLNARGTRLHNPMGIVEIAVGLSSLSYFPNLAWRFEVVFLIIHCMYYNENIGPDEHATLVRRPSGHPSFAHCLLVLRINNIIYNKHIIMAPLRRPMHQKA